MGGHAALLPLVFAFFSCVPEEATAAMGLSRQHEAALMSGRSVLQLNESSFRRRVFEETTGAAATNWIVLFCEKGNEHCETLMPSFENLFLRTLDRAKNDVRFATMDCSSEASEFCRQQGMETLPMVAHYRGRERLGQWTSGGSVGLLPWLLRQSAPDGSAKERERMPAPGMSATTPAKDDAWPDIGSLLEVSFIRSFAGMFCLGSPTETTFGAEPVCGVSHLSDLHDLILLEDCLFSRTLSTTLTVAILGKVVWIIVRDAELLPSRLDKHASASPTSFLA